MSFRLYVRRPKGKQKPKREFAPLPDAGDARRAKSALSGFQELNVTRDFEIPTAGKITLPMAQLGDEK